jgi:TP53 regulating kinase and related kinases
MKQEIIQQGAEAIISLKDNKIIKHRTTKSYRYPELDNKIKKTRTKSEAKIIEKLKNIINVPKIILTDLVTYKIHMEHIKGKRLSNDLEKINYKKICKQIGEDLTKLHNQDIIHGDLTTSNMIEKNKKIYFIDFGLGFHSRKIEDKAVDLHLLKQALEAKHYKIADQCIKIILKNYKPEQYKLIIQRIPVIESRGRYKKKH